MKIVWDNPIQHVALHQGLDARYWPDVSETDGFAVIAIMKANRALRVGHRLRAEIEHSVMTSLTKAVCHMDPSIAFLYWLLLLINRQVFVSSYFWESSIISSCCMFNLSEPYLFLVPSCLNKALACLSYRTFFTNQDPFSNQPWHKSRNA